MWFRGSVRIEKRTSLSLARFGFSVLVKHAMAFLCKREIDIFQNDGHFLLLEYSRSNEQIFSIILLFFSCMSKAIMIFHFIEFKKPKRCTIPMLNWWPIRKDRWKKSKFSTWISFSSEEGGTRAFYSIFTYSLCPLIDRNTWAFLSLILLFAFYCVFVWGALCEVF